MVNVLLNDDFQGVAISGRFGFAERADIQDQRYSGVAGFGDEHTRIVVGAQYEEQDPVFSGDRDFSRNAPGSTNFGDKITIAGQSAYLNTGYPTVPQQVIPLSVAPILNSPNQVVGAGTIAPLFNAAGTQVFSNAQFPAGTYSTAAANTRTLLLQRYTAITLDQNRLNAYGSVERDIFDKYLTVFGDFLYSRNYSQSYLAPQPVTTASSPNPSQNMVIPLGAPFNPFNSEIGYAQTQVPTTAANAAAGTPRTGGLVVTNRFLSAPRVFRNDTDFYRIVAGLKGQVFKDYNYEVAFNHSEDTINFKNFNLIRGDLVTQALAGGYNADGTAAPATFNANGTVATPAGPYSRVNGVLTPALDAFAVNNPAATQNLILGTDIRNQQSKLTVIDGKFTGFPVTLPAGPLGFAVGGEYRLEELRLNSSVENFVASVPVSDVQVSRGIEAAFLEVSIPIVSPTMKIPGVYSFDIDAAGRYEHYEGTGDNVVPKVSFVYRPIQDVALRGTYAKSFRAPNLIETNGPASSGFTALTNLGAGFSEQANVISSNNPLLGPERTDTWDAGIVISPHQIPGLTISGDFFHVEERNIITNGVPAATILASVNSLGQASPYANLLRVGSQTGPAFTNAAGGAPGAYIAGNASNFYILTNPVNSSNLRESGVDFTINYDHDFGKFGGATIGLNGTYYLQYKVNDFKDGPMYDQVGLYLGGIGGNYVPDYKLVPYASYRFGGASVTALMNYIPSMRDGASFDNSDRAGSYTTYNQGNYPKIRDYYEIDMTVSYEFGLNKPKEMAAPAPAPKDGKDGGKQVVTSREEARKMMNFNLLDGLKLTFGVNNITNARPPQINDSPDSSNSDVAIYDPYQRYYYFVVSKKF